jgi:hypothetical protein
MAAKKDKKKGYMGYNAITKEKGELERARLSAKKERSLANAAGRPTNAAFAATDEGFKAACEKANTPATARQASKWLRQRGLAYTKGR